MIPGLKQLELLLGAAAEKAHAYSTVFEGFGNELGLLGRIWLTISRFEEAAMESLRQSSEFGEPTSQMVNILHKSGYAAVRAQQICSKSSTLLKGLLSTKAFLVWVCTQLDLERSQITTTSCRRY